MEYIKVGCMLIWVFDWATWCGNALLLAWEHCFNKKHGCYIILLNGTLDFAPLPAAWAFNV